jgi:hypothetical protein
VILTAIKLELDAVLKVDAGAVPLPPDAVARRRGRHGAPHRSNDYSGARWRDRDLPALGWRHRRHYDMRATFITLAIEDGADPDVIETASDVESGVGQQHRNLFAAVSVDSTARPDQVLDNRECGSEHSSPTAAPSSWFTFPKSSRSMKRIDSGASLPTNANSTGSARSHARLLRRPIGSSSGLRSSSSRVAQSRSRPAWLIATATGEPLVNCNIRLL